MLQELSALAQALSDPVRLRILKLLALRDLCVCELVYLLPAGQSRVTQNLAILKHAGLVSDRREGRWVHYSLNRLALDEALSGLRRLVIETDLASVPEMAGEAQRWQTMPVDNPRGVCAPQAEAGSTLDAGDARRDTGYRVQQGKISGLTARNQ